MRRETAEPKTKPALPVAAQLAGAGALPIRERFGVTVPVAASFIGISRTRVYELLQDGTLQGKIIHGRRIVIVASLLRMVGEAPNAKREAAA